MEQTNAWLVGLLAMSNLYWAWQVHGLINKLMSRNYFEFKEAQLSAEKKKGTLKSNEPDTTPIDDAQLGAVTEILS